MIHFMVEICLLLTFIGILIAYLVQKYPISNPIKTETFSLSTGSITKTSQNAWNFIPSKNYVGNVILNYQVSDGITSPISDTASFQIN